MKYEELLRDTETVEWDFSAKMLRGDKPYKTLTELKEELENRKPSKLYPRIVKYNQFRILTRFIEKLQEKFGDRFLIQDNDLTYLNMSVREEDVEQDRPTATAICTSTNDPKPYLKFSIGEYFYYIQFWENPLFESSYIITKKIHKMYGNYYFREYFAEDENINNYIDDLYSVECNVEKGADNLLAFFMREKFEKESHLCTRDPRIFILTDKGTQDIPLE